MEQARAIKNFIGAFLLFLGIFIMLAVLGVISSGVFFDFSLSSDMYFYATATAIVAALGYAILKGK